MSYCGNSPGMCGKRADCADHHCPGKQMALGLHRLHMEDGGERVDTEPARLPKPLLYFACFVAAAVRAWPF